MSRLGEDVTHRLRRDVVGGRFAVGQRLTEASLSEQYGVSRVPVREALKALEGEGFVTSRAYAGVTVARLDAADARDLFVVRETIEVLTTSRLAQRFADSPAEVDGGRLSDLVAEGTSLLGTDDDRLPALNTEFHLCLAELCGNASLHHLLRQVSAKIEWLYAMDVHVRGQHSWAEHGQIATAVLAGRVDEAADAMRHHVRNSRDGYLLRHAP
ncbi:GntR family transcriptional regulator [Solicola sp. PLA-1-18]|uniref:GntR family transcriptional regulator n=1 Tax=Solicola sp. PLA-1-18 TaxID=3380532 RepID=UPI003B805189